jgi:hypothetical protein
MRGIVETRMEHSGLTRMERQRQRRPYSEVQKWMTEAIMSKPCAAGNLDILTCEFTHAPWLSRPSCLDTRIVIGIRPPSQYRQYRDLGGEVKKTSGQDTNWI